MPTRWSIDAANVITAITTPTAVAAVIIVERAGTGRDLEPGSSANRTPVVAAIEAPLDASRALTRDGRGSSAAANTREFRHAGQSPTAHVMIATQSRTEEQDPPVGGEPGGRSRRAAPDRSAPPATAGR